MSFVLFNWTDDWYCIFLCPLNSDIAGGTVGLSMPERRNLSANGRRSNELPMRGQLCRPVLRCEAKPVPAGGRLVEGGDCGAGVADHHGDRLCNGTLPLLSAKARRVSLLIFFYAYGNYRHLVFALRFLPMNST